MKTKHLSRLFGALLLVATVAGMQLPACAGLYVYEGFDYYLGDEYFPTNLVPATPDKGQNGGFGWNGPWYTGLVIPGFHIISTSLHPPTEATTPLGGSITETLAPSHHFWAQRYLNPLTIHPGETLWFSVDMASSAVPDTATIVNFEFISGYHMGFYTMSLGGQGQPLHWALEEYGTDYGPFVSPDAPTLLVAALHLDSSPNQFTFKFWVNPGPASCAGDEPLDLPVATKIFPGASAFATLNDVQLIVDNNSLSSASSLHQIDEIRIGSTYNDVNLAPAPRLNSPTAITVQCDSDVPMPVVGPIMFQLIGGSVSGGTAPVDVSSTSDAASGSCPKTITRTYTATDACERTATCTQTITVQDTTPPVIGAAGANATIECPATPEFTAPTATDNCDPAPQVVEDSDVTSPGACPGSYLRTKTWHARDACGNVSAPVSQTITVQDTISPVLICPASQIIHGGASPVSFSAIASDNCDPAPMITFDPPSGSIFPVGTTLVTSVATDQCGNSRTCTFNVVVLGEPIAREDDFWIPTGAPIAISISALLANDGHSGGLPISFAGCDASTSQGLPLTILGSPATALIYPATYNVDSFNYRITDGVIERTGLVQIRLMSYSAPPTDALSCAIANDSQAFLAQFRSSTAGTYVLERQAISCSGGGSGAWTEISRQTTTGDSIISFLDGPLPCGALYRVRHVP